MKQFVITLFLVLLFNSCQFKPEEIRVGKDNCAFCKMTISDACFGAEVITLKGKIFKYDELHCLLNDIEKGNMLKTNIHEIFLTDFCGKHNLLKSDVALFLRSSELKSPMGGNVAAFADTQSLLSTMQKIKGDQLTWDEVYNERK